MPQIQVIKGKAFEYATANAIAEKYRYFGDVEIVQNTSYNLAFEYFTIYLSAEEQLNYARASSHAVEQLFLLEPMLTQDNSVLTISIAEDGFGIDGDVRDVIISKRDLDWEIGVSCKHNHEALKHQRLSANIDFGNSWAGYPVSQNYWNTVLPIFEELSDFRSRKINWRDLGNYGFDKVNDVYIPLLTAFLNEFNHLDASHSDLATKFMEYLAGRKDFYKFVMNESGQYVDIYTYNLHGNLNKGGTTLAQVVLPTQFIYKGWKTNRNGNQSDNTLVIEMDNDWAVSLRLHSAASLVETSLKFDSQPISLPSELQIFRVNY
ncbi:HaeIII family restriction endonuclease [Lactococcus petauri]|uniref:HaeIII family restriction endonuclease n=1 Tax=Lactococcus petauri TaxID=1940789 RepID=UPI00232BF032|nr:HaeIII family restriction endonuclease [Lactococcus petauri]MDC0811236.1 HaeIII family restriction endonuclease [Lactococcus petauri]